jgi:hypothetical protein
VRGAGGVPQVDPDTREELAGREALTDVVVGAGVERGDLVNFLAPR